MSESYWKRQCEAATQLNIILRDQLLGLEAELVSSRLERTHLLNLIAKLSRNANEQITSNSSGNGRGPGPDYGGLGG